MFAENISKIIVKCNLDIVVVKEVVWVEGGGQPAENYIVLYGNVNANHHLEIGFFVYKGIISEGRRLDFVNDRLS
jgi:hypothetical protein